MKQYHAQFSREYLRTLRAHLASCGVALTTSMAGRRGLEVAMKLGRRAVKAGLETLDLARIHNRVFAMLVPSGKPRRMARRAEAFFAEAVGPITDTHRAARRNRLEMKRLTQALDRRTHQVAASNVRLRHGMRRRLLAEAALRAGTEQHLVLLEESRLREDTLRKWVHEVMVTQEKERFSTSCRLRDDLGQAMLGIHARMLWLEGRALLNARGLGKDLTDARQKVIKSAMSVQRAARRMSNL